MGISKMKTILEFVVKNKLIKQKEYPVYFDTHYEEYYVFTESIKDFDALTIPNLSNNQYKLIRQRIVEENLYDDNYIFLEPGELKSLHWNKVEKKKLNKKYAATQYTIGVKDFNYKYWKNMFN